MCSREKFEGSQKILEEKEKIIGCKHINHQALSATVIKISYTSPNCIRGFPWQNEGCPVVRVGGNEYWNLEEKELK